MTALVCAHCGGTDWSSRWGTRYSWTTINGVEVPLHEGDCDVQYAMTHKTMKRTPEKPKVTNTAKPYRGSKPR